MEHKHRAVRGDVRGALRPHGLHFSEPAGEFTPEETVRRLNLLRAYDELSNTFSLSQADVVLENVLDPPNGKRFGVPLDVQFGQGTETLRGNPAEVRALLGGAQRGVRPLGGVPNLDQTMLAQGHPHGLVLPSRRASPV